MSWISYRPSKRTVFVALMALCALNLWVGRPAWTNFMKQVLQPLVPFQDAAYTLTHHAMVGAQAASQPELDDDARQRQALEHVLYSQQGQIAELQRQVDDLRALRNMGLPMYLPLLRAQVVARDMVASRDTLLIGRGAGRGVHPKDWVASRLFLNSGHAAGLAEGQIVLGHETLIGRVEMVGTFMSRVQLLTDRDSLRRVGVHFGRYDNGELRLAEYEGTLTGHGGGEMVVEMVAERFVKEGELEDPEDDARRIHLGDHVFTRPDQLGIPVPLVVGRVQRFDPDLERRLVVDVIVVPIAALDDLKEVFVIPAVPAGPIPLGK